MEVEKMKTKYKMKMENGICLVGEVYTFDELTPFLFNSNLVREVLVDGDAKEIIVIRAKD